MRRLREGAGLIEQFVALQDQFLVPFAPIGTEGDRDPLLTAEPQRLIRGASAPRLSISAADALRG